MSISTNPYQTSLHQEFRKGLPRFCRKYILIKGRSSLRHKKSPDIDYGDLDTPKGNTNVLVFDKERDTLEFLVESTPIKGSESNKGVYGSD